MSVKSTSRKKKAAAAQEEEARLRQHDMFRKFPIRAMQTCVNAVDLETCRKYACTRACIYLKIAVDPAEDEPV